MQLTSVRPSVQKLSAFEIKNIWFSPHLSLVLLSNVSLSSTNPGPKKGTDNFLIGEQTSNLDQGMGVFVCGLQPTRIALWASIGRPSSQARVTSVNSSSSLMSPETRARRRGLSSSMGQGMFLTHFVVFDQTSSFDHNNITKLWPLDGSFGQSSELKHSCNKAVWVWFSPCGTVNDWYACTLGLCRWCLLTGYISSKRLKRLLKKRWRLAAF